MEKKSYTFWYEFKYNKKPKSVATMALGHAPRAPLE